MAPYQAKRNTRNLGRQPTLSKDQGKQPQGITKERTQLSRRSARLQRHQEGTVTKTTSTKPKHLLPSPTSNTPSREFSQAEDRNRKRKRTEGESPFLSAVTPAQKRPRASPPRSPIEHILGKNTAQVIEQDRKRKQPEEDDFTSPPSKRPDCQCSTLPQNNCIDESTTLRQTSNILHDPVAHWVTTSFLPSKDQLIMSGTVSNKRRSESTHRSDCTKRLVDNGIYMKSSAAMQKSSKALCQRLISQSHAPLCYTPFPIDQLPNVLDRVQGLNESRVQRDITPWIVPSAECLFFSGELEVDYIGDEVNADWSKCATMGSSRPKPDYTAGLLRRAFTKDEIEKLENYATPDNPFLFTPEISFPFLICEVKTGEQGLNKAERQNIHSASIAVRAIISLHKIAYGSSDPQRLAELYGKILVFTVSHDNDRVCLYGHFALESDTSNKPECYRYLIAIYSMSANDGSQRHAASDFVRNIYAEFAAEHRKRIQEAVKLLPTPAERTALSFSTSELALGETNSQQHSQDSQSQDGNAFKLPRLPASSLQGEDTKIKQQEQISKLLDQLNQQREDAREQREKMEQQMERQRKQMEQQMEQQRKQMEQQMEQQKELIALLKQKCT